MFLPRWELQGVEVPAQLAQSIGEAENIEFL